MGKFFELISSLVSDQRGGASHPVVAFLFLFSCCSAHCALNFLQYTLEDLGKTSIPSSICCWLSNSLKVSFLWQWMWQIYLINWTFFMTSYDFFNVINVPRVIIHCVIYRGSPQWLLNYDCAIKLYQWLSAKLFSLARCNATKRDTEQH